MKLVIASTGGSGSGYLLRLFYHLLTAPGQTHWMTSDNFSTVMDSEFGFTLNDVSFGQDSKGHDELVDKIAQLYPVDKAAVCHRFVRCNYRDLSEPPSSGSVFYDAMIVVPCSMKTLGAISAGVSSNLIERAADVALKERRRLILVPRETPYSLIHLENMRRLTLAGAVILPASPGFYHKPKTLDEIYDFIVDRILAQAGLEKRAIRAWKE